MKFSKVVAFVVVLFSLNITSLEAQTISTFSAETGILRIPNLVFNNEVYDYLELSINESGLLDIVEVGPITSNTAIPADATFVFLDSNTLMIPVIEFGGEYFYNVELAITPELQLVVSGLETQAGELLYRDGGTTQLDAPVVVSSNINSVQYPGSYQNISTLSVELLAPECNLLPSTIVYPSSWLGDRPLPEISGAPFDSEVEFGLGIKDIWLPANPAYNNGCSGDYKENFKSLIRRAKSINASYIEIFPWTLVDDSADIWRIANPQELNDTIFASTISDEDIAWLTNEAHANGIAVHWRNQIQGRIDYSIPDETVANMQRFNAAYEEFMLERADFLQSIGIDAMQFDCTCWFEWYVDNEVTDTFFQALDVLVVELENRFSGTLFAEQSTIHLRHSNIIDKLDRTFVDLQQYLELSAEEQSVLDVDTIKTHYINAINGIASQYPQSILDSVKFVFEVGAPSRANFFQRPGYVETSLCTPGVDSVTQQSTSCEQQSMAVDFSLQARLIEAQLEAIKEQTAISNYHVGSTSYWMAPVLLPSDTFPNLDQSIRNKPAEKIFQIWFDR
ncbi:MAG: hypothetical protein IIC60_11770 [Proteobacteria bacterium]|nr:hypothetical protein [Pseudomonadota bacterium]